MSIVTPIVRQWIEDGLADPEAFWARAAGELPWFRQWDQVFEWTFPTFRWFIGAETNLAYNALDRHVAEGRGGHPALIYMNERGERRTLHATPSFWRWSNRSPPRCVRSGSARAIASRSTCRRRRRRSR